MWCFVTRDGQVASLIGTYAPTALNIRVAENWDAETVTRHLVHVDKLKIDCLLAPIRPRTADDVGPDFYRQVVRVLQTTHDVVIMDCSVNYLDPLISTVCLPEASAVLFITTMATTAVQGMARALQELAGDPERGGMGIPKEKIGIVVNQSVAGVGLDREQVTQAALGVNVVGAIPLSTNDVLRATNSTRMHLLLRHPVLGPAYMRLAKVCLPKHGLADIIKSEDNAAPEAHPAYAAMDSDVARAESAAASAQQAATAAQKAAGSLAPEADGKPKRRLLGRKG